MIIFGWGHVTKRFFGIVSTHHCERCGQASGWQLCVMRTWFTLFFIPVIPYETVYCMVCERCGGYVALEKERFEELKAALQQGEDEALKYAGKTPTQIAYLKGQEEARRKQEQSNDH